MGASGFMEHLEDLLETYTKAVVASVQSESDEDRQMAKKSIYDTIDHILDDTFMVAQKAFTVDHTMN